MLREHLYRGKRKDNGEWVYGDFTHNKKCEIIRQWNCQPLSMDENGNYHSKIYACADCEVDPETVSEFTGWCDKNGTLIFEGNIVKFCGMVGVIVFEKGAFGIGSLETIDYDLLEKEMSRNSCNLPEFCGNDNFISLWELCWNFNSEDEQLDMVEVIGNKWDNPELLEKTV